MKYIKNIPRKIEKVRRIDVIINILFALRRDSFSMLITIELIERSNFAPISDNLFFDLAISSRDASNPVQIFPISATISIDTSL